MNDQLADRGASPRARREDGRPRRREGGAMDTRTALIRVGTEILTEQGFNGTGIEAVLRRLQVPKGSFYHHFRSKDAFGEAVIANYGDYFARKLDRLVGDEAHPPLARLAAFVEEAKEGMSRFAFRRGCLVGNLGQEMAGLNEPFRAQLSAILDSWRDRLATLLEAAKAAGELDAHEDARAAAEFFWIGWEGAVLRSKLARSVEPLDRFADTFFRRVLGREPRRPARARKTRGDHVQGDPARES
jgi:TetR/AcrR family transcriptional repressor of nem operon